MVYKFLTAVVIIGGLILMVVYREQINTSLTQECSGFSISEAKDVTSSIERNKDSYLTSSRNITGLSTEGGVEMTYFDKDTNQRKLITQTFYGEIFRSDIRYSLINGAVFFVKVDRLDYEKSVFEDSQPTIKGSFTREYYMNSNKKLCSWYSDGVLQINNKEAEEFIDFLLSNVEFDTTKWGQGV